MTLSEIEEQYKDEWILVEVLREDEAGNPIEVNLIAHSPRREDTYDALSSASEGKSFYHFYNGKVPKEGYAAAF